MTKPTIVTRAGKGVALTYEEQDANFTNLQDATITVTDGTNSHALNLNDTLIFTAGTNVTLSVNSSTGAVTINASGGGTLGGTASSDIDMNGYRIKDTVNDIVTVSSDILTVTELSGGKSIFIEPNNNQIYFPGGITAKILTYQNLSLDCDTVLMPSHASTFYTGGMGVAGGIGYDSTNNVLKFYDGTAWTNIVASTSGSVSLSGDLTVTGTTYDKGIMINGDRGNVYLGNDTRDARTVFVTNSAAGYYSGYRIDRAGSEWYFMGADNLNQFVIRTAGTTNAMVIDGSGYAYFENDLTLFGDLKVGGNTSINLVNTTATTVNFAGAATSLHMGASSGTTTINNNLSLASGKTISTTGTITGNATTAFVAGTNSANNVALQMSDQGAIRNIKNGANTMYFDTSTGGSTHGDFQFRSSSSFTNFLTLNSTGAVIAGTVQAQTPYVGRTSWNAAIDTEVIVDDYRFRVSNQGGIYPQIISNTGGTVNTAWTAIGAVNGTAVTQVGSTGILLPNGSWTTLYNPHGMDASGDTVTVTLQNKAAGRIYRVTFMRSDAGSTGYNIIVERLL